MHPNPEITPEEALERRQRAQELANQLIGDIDQAIDIKADLYAAEAEVKRANERLTQAHGRYQEARKRNEKTQAAIRELGFGNPDTFVRGGRLYKLHWDGDVEQRAACNLDKVHQSKLAEATRE